VAHTLCHISSARDRRSPNFGMPGDNGRRCALPPMARPVCQLPTRSRIREQLASRVEPNAIDAAQAEPIGDGEPHVVAIRRRLIALAIDP
jgi:hypothetical protein